MVAGDLEWNYVKFLVGRDGVPRKRFNSLYNPTDFEGDVRPCPITHPCCSLSLVPEAISCHTYAPMAVCKLLGISMDLLLPEHQSSAAADCLCHEGWLYTLACQKE